MGQRRHFFSLVFFPATLAFGLVLPILLTSTAAAAPAQGAAGGSAAPAAVSPAAANAAGAGAAGSTAGTADKPQPAPSMGAPRAVDNCPTNITPGTTATPGTPQGTMRVASNTRWQPFGGDFLVELTNLSTQPDDVRAWFRWQDDPGPKYCYGSSNVQFVGKSTAGSNTTYTYSVRLPDLDDNPNSFPWIEGWKHRSWTSVVPLANIYVRPSWRDSKSGPSVEMLMVGPVAVSTPWIAFVFATVLVALAWFCLVHWATERGVPGTPFLRVISTPHGVASLSQFQIVIWTTVIGAGVTYVMLVSGNLIDVPGTTLGLLGITGFTLVGSKLQASSGGTPQRASAPGVPTNLVVAGAPTSDTIALNWAAPAGAVQPFGYVVQMRLAGQGPWITAGTDIGAPPYAVKGLQPATSYDFQVYATNSAGAGPASLLVTQPTAAVAAPGAAAPGQVTGLAAKAQPNGTVILSWSALNPAPATYVVQYRETGTLAWATYSNTANSPITVSGLTSSTSIEFLVFAITGGVAGTPSTIVQVQTATRLPRWSDLVMSGDTDTEIDLTRVQMLLFTTIAAAFTGMTLLDTGEIPDIPLGVLALVGLSNGVYLASKAVGSNR